MIFEVISPCRKHKYKSHTKANINTRYTFSAPSTKEFYHPPSLAPRFRMPAAAPSQCEDPLVRSRTTFHATHVHMLPKDHKDYSGKG